jgi:hypothetical protein
MLEHGLVAFAGLLFCFEGPAEVALVVALVGLWLAAPRDDWPRFGWIEGLIAGWAVSGWLGVIRAAVEGHPSSSEDVLRPLLALAFLVGRFGYATATSKVLARVWAAILGVMLLNGIVGLAQVTFGALPIDRWFLKNPNSPPDLGAREDSARFVARPGLLYNRLKFAHLGFPAVGLFLIGRTGRRWSDLGQWGGRWRHHHGPPVCPRPGGLGCISVGAGGVAAVFAPTDRDLDPRRWSGGGPRSGGWGGATRLGGEGLGGRLDSRSHL